LKAIEDRVAGTAIRLGKGQTRHLYADRTQQLAQPQQCLATARCVTTILAFTDDFAVGAQDCMLEANQTAQKTLADNYSSSCSHSVEQPHRSGADPQLSQFRSGSLISPTFIKSVAGHRQIT